MRSLQSYEVEVAEISEDIVDIMEGPREDSPHFKVYVKLKLFLVSFVTETERDRKSEMLQLSPEQEVRRNLPNPA